MKKTGLTLLISLLSLPNPAFGSSTAAPLSRAEVKALGLLRLWHTTPVVEGFVPPGDYKSAAGYISYIPDQAQGFHARVRRGLVRELACPAAAASARESGVVGFEGVSYAQAPEPRLTEEQSRLPERFKKTTAFQAGEDFSVGAWVKFSNSETALHALSKNELLRQMVPPFYSLAGKMRDPKWTGGGREPLRQKAEWQIYLTGEMLYVHTYPSREKTDFYVSQSLADQYTEYENCRRDEVSQPAIPLSGKRKPVPVPIPLPRASACSRPELPPPPFIFPPGDSSETKRHFVEWDLKNKFAWGETYASSYIGGAHHESWHFVNLSFHLGDRIAPSVTVTTISSPFFGDGHSVPPSPETWNRKQFNMRIDRELARQLRHESDSPVTIGYRGNGAAPSPHAQAFQSLRSGTYISRSALSSAQVDRLAKLLYPVEAADCQALLLEKVK